MSNAREAAMDEAIAWHLGLEQAGAEQWHDFVAWLEADPAHGAAYDRLTLDDAALQAPATVPAPPAAVPPRLRRGWLRWGGAAAGLAAAAAAAWIALLPAPVPSDPYRLETAPGAPREVALADGTRIRMNGGTRLLLDRRDDRVATLEEGQAMFRVVHHADRPFELRTGGVTLRDVGTMFDVVRSGARLQVGVAEGEVLYQPEGAKVSLTRGMVLASRDGAGEATVTHVEPDGIGGWTSGHLDFRDASLSAVADDLTRSTGAPVAVAPAMAERRFTGTLRLDRPAGEVARSLAALTDGVAVRDGRGWTIAPRTDGAR